MNGFSLHIETPSDLFVALFLGYIQYWAGVFIFFVVLCPGASERSLAMAMGHSIKSHPTDWEKPGIKPATPGLQDIGLSPTPFCGSPWYL